MRNTRIAPFALALGLAAVSPHSTAQELVDEPVLFFTARADQTGTPNGGTVHYVLGDGTWQWWFQNVRYASSSPNGKQVAYVFGETLLVADANGQNPRPLFDAARLWWPVWAPDGKRIACFTGDQVRQYVTATDLNRDDIVFFSVYGAEGVRTTYAVINPRIRVIDLDGEVEAELPYRPGPGRSSPDVMPRSLSWSPDGKTIAYEKWPSIYGFQPASGTDSPLYTAREILSDPPGVPRLVFREFLRNPRWHPDGTRIAVDYSTTVPNEGTDYNIAYFPVGGGDPVTMTSGPRARTPLAADLEGISFPTVGAWSPDGTELAYVRMTPRDYGFVGATPTADVWAAVGTHVIRADGSSEKISSWIPWTGTPTSAAYHMQWTNWNPPTLVDLEIRVPDDQLLKGQTVSVDVVVQLDGDESRTIRFNELLASSDQSVAKVDEVELPPSFELTPDQPSRTFSAEVALLNEGEADLRSRAAILNSEGLVEKLLTENAPLVIEAGKGDLHISLSDGNAGAKTETFEWVGDNIYQDFPIGEQRHEIAILPEAKSEIILFLENDAAEEQTFSLKVSETFGDGWNPTYSNLSGGPDISSAVTSDAGWRITLAPDEGRNFSLAVSPSSGATSTQKSFVFTLHNVDTPDETSDAVEVVVDRTPLTVTIDPEYPLVGQQATVTVKFVNDTGRALANVRPILPHGFGDAFERLEEMIEPQSVAPGETVLFEMNFWVAQEGTFHIASGVRADDGFEVAGRSRETQNGTLTIQDIELVQAVKGAPLIKGKFAAVEAKLKSTSPVNQKFGWDVTGPELVPQWSVEFDEKFPGNTETTTLVPLHLNTPKSLNELGVWKFTLIHPDRQVRDYPKRTAEFEVEELIETRALSMAFWTVVLPAELDVPRVPGAVSDLIKTNHGRYINSAFPMPWTFIDQDQVKMPIQLSDKPWDHWNRLTMQGTMAAMANGYDRIILIFPDDPRVWPLTDPGEGKEAERAIGWANADLDFKHAPTVVGHPDLGDPLHGVSAHEIIHTFGIDHVAPADAAAESTGYAIDLFNRATVKLDAPDLMLPYADPDAWISRRDYESMVLNLSQPFIDPEVIVLGGIIKADGSVESGAWYSAWTDIVSQASAEGEYAVEMLDSEGGKLVDHHFDASFERVASLAPGSTGRSTATSPSSPFAFSLPRPEGVRRIKIMKGDEVLHERPVTQHSPAITAATPLDRRRFATGETVSLSWEANDADGDSLETQVSWSPTGGDAWRPILLQVAETAVEWTVPDKSTRSGWIRLLVSDGVNTTIKDLGPFTIEGSESALVARAGRDVITRPDTETSLDGAASYATDGSAISHVWRKIFGPPEVEIDLTDAETDRASFLPKEVGTYVFRLEVTDSQGRTSFADKSVFVRDDLRHLPRAALEIRQLADGRIELRWPQSPGAYPQRATELETGDWSRLVAPRETRNGFHVLTVSRGRFQEFFRLQAQP